MKRPNTSDTQLRLAVLDWAGTTVDHGSRGPVTALRRGFEAEGLSISEAEARRPMGQHKRDHIRAILEHAEVASRWRSLRGAPPTGADLDAIYQRFVGLQMATLPEHAQPIPGAIEAVARLRESGMAIGSSTGYTRPMMDVLAPLAADQGYRPDALVCSDDVPAGRPAPWMIYVNATRLGVYPMHEVVKIGDTPADMLAGRNAGCWNIGVAMSGNEVGLTQPDLEALSATERQRLRQAAVRQLLSAGAHYVVDRLADCDVAIETINRRLFDGERP